MKFQDHIETKEHPFSVSIPFLRNVIEMDKNLDMKTLRVCYNSLKSNTLKFYILKMICNHYDCEIPDMNPDKL